MNNLVASLPTPSVAVLVSTFNEERYLERCLESLLAQDYPRDRMRVLVIDGGSTDATVALAERFARDDARFEVMADGVRRNLPESLNLARGHTDCDLVAKVDAHGYPEHDFLRLAAEGLTEGGPRVGCVGGRPVQEGETRFGKAVALARTSRFGVGASEYAGASERGPVDTVQCGVYRRSALDEVGWFDGEMNYGEDEELNWRLREAGYEILLDARMRFHYFTRPSWRAAYRQYRNYGEARVRVVREHPRFLRVHHLIPAAMVAGGAALAVAAPFSHAARVVLAALAGMYAAVALAAAVGATRRARLSLAPLVASCFAALHMGYGIGTLRGLARLGAAARALSRSGPLSSEAS
jgi:glycosyltransferase involved in cell wall biosynthesis